MDDLWQKIFHALTRGADMRVVVRHSFILAFFATLFTLPYFHHLIFEIRLGDNAPVGFNPWHFLIIELFFLFLLCFLSAIIGLSFVKKFDLPGFGDPKAFLRALPLLLLLGGVMTLLSYLFFDRFFVEISPKSYPKDLLYLISVPFKGAFTDEIILRLCLVTLGVGLLKSKNGGVVLIAALASLFSFKYFHFLGIPFEWNDLFFAQFLISFWANLLLGYLFISRGLLYAMALKFIFGIKYVFVSLII